MASAHTAFVEADFLLRACENPELRQAHAVHTCAGAAGMGCFAAETARPKLRYVHGLWHLLSATSLATTNALLAHYEEKRGLGRGGVTWAAWPLPLWGFGGQKMEPKLEGESASGDEGSAEGSWRIQSV